MSKHRSHHRPALFGAFLAALLVLLLLLQPETVHAQTQQRSVISRVQPEYPALALRMHVSGSVIVLASIAPNGTVSQVRATHGHALLQGPAEQAVRQWRFAKAPTPSDTVVQVQFTLDPHQ